MKIVSVLFLAIATVNQIDSIPKEEYYRTRKGYEYEILKLYENDKYSYKYWMHLGYYVRDTGNYIRNNDILILNSISSERGNTRKNGKNKVDSTVRHFAQDTLLVQEDKIILLSKGENETKLIRRLLHKKE